MNTANVRSRPVLPSVLLGVVLAATFLAGCTTTGQNHVIAVRAQADPAYVAGQTEPSGGPKKYVFAEGRFFPSAFDSGTAKQDFDRLTKILAADLLPRFTPVTSAGQADLVIVVHWGAVERRERPSENPFYDVDAIRQAGDGVETARTQAAADFKAGNYASYGQVAAAEANLRNEMRIADSVYTGDALAAANTAELIGVRGLYRNDDPSAEADQLRSLLEEDRYFVTLIAYDAEGLRLKQKWPRWRIRMSAPVAGRDFTTAVREMSAVAAPLYGRQHPGMVLQSPAASTP